MIGKWNIHIHESVENETPNFFSFNNAVLNNRFWQLIEKLASNDIYYHISGGPEFLTPEISKKLKILNCTQFQMSLEGLRKTHDAIKNKGSYDNTFEKIKLLKSSSIRTCIKTKVTKENIGQIPWIIDDVVRAKVDLYKIQLTCDKLRCGNHYSIYEKLRQYRNENTMFVLDYGDGSYKIRL